MLRAALRSVLARKVRLVLTGVSVLLGVSFMAGTYVLTDTMTRAFDDGSTRGSSAGWRARAIIRGRRRPRSWPSA